MISFENPSFLFGLTGLMIAVCIHLLSRKPARVVYAGSVRHLDGSASRQFKSIRLNEVLLLILRMILLAIFCLIVSGPFLSTSSKDHRWVLIEKGLEHHPMIAKAVDSLRTLGYDLRHLADGFPELHTDSVRLPAGSYWTLAHALERQSIDDAVIFYRQRAEGFYGSRRATPPHQRWIPVTSDSITFYSVSAVAVADSVRIRMAKTNSQKTTFETRMQPLNHAEKFLVTGHDSVLISPPDTIHIAIHTGKGLENDARIFQAAFRVLEKMSKTKFVVSLNDRTKVNDWIIMLSDDPVFRQGDESSIVFNNDPESPLLTNAGPRRWLLNHHLTMADAIDQNFAVALARIILPEEKYQLLITEKDRRISQADVWNEKTTTTNVKNNFQQKESLVPVLLLIMMAVLISERLISSKRKQ